MTTDANGQIFYRIAQPEDLENIYQFAEKKMAEVIPDEMERMMKIWSSRFQKEALEHYLKLGWSFIAEEGLAGNTKESQETKALADTVEVRKIVGFFIGQPFLFFQGRTQSLWIEYIIARNLEIKKELVEIAYKLARDKHFQQVLFPEEIEGLTTAFRLQKIAEPFLFTKTTK